MKRMTSSVVSKCPATNRCPGTRNRKLGGMAADVIDMTVEIVGDYGDVLKRYDMKAGDSLPIALKPGTALKITDGSCTITPAQKKPE